MTTPNVMSCEEALRLLATFLDRELSQAEHAEVEVHLHRCLTCYSRAEFERRLKARLAALGSVDPSPELQRRVHAAIARFPQR
jgi:anti-sigma factor (TIGR02949 family)